MNKITIPFPKRADSDSLGQDILSKFPQLHGKINIISKNEVENLIEIDAVTDLEKELRAIVDIHSKGMVRPDVQRSKEELDAIIDFGNKLVNEITRRDTATTVAVVTYVDDHIDKTKAMILAELAKIEKHCSSLHGMCAENKNRIDVLSDNVEDYVKQKKQELEKLFDGAKANIESLLKEQQKQVASLEEAYQQKIKTVEDSAATSKQMIEGFLMHLSSFKK